MKASLVALLLVLAAWLGLQATWLGQDERIREGDVLGHVGAIENFSGFAQTMSPPAVLLRSYVEYFGEYPQLYPASTGILAHALGVTDLNGDGPTQVALLWSLLAVLGTLALGWAFAGPRSGAIAASLLMLSPLWTALQRQVLPENAVTALVAMCAAAGLWACRYGASGRRGGAVLLWLLCGLFAAEALLSKQTAALALAPLALALVVAARPQQAGGSEADAPASSGRWGWLLGPAAAAAATLLLAGPWYLRRMSGNDGYLWRSAQENPDAVGLLHQLLYYPLVMLQQPLAPVSLAVLVALGLRLRHKGRSGLPRRPAEGEDDALRRHWQGLWRVGLLAAVCILGVLLLMMIPKKYPRLLLPLLPLAAVVVATLMSRWQKRYLSAALVVLSVSLLGSSFSLGPVSRALGIGSLGIVDVDERCYQRWVEPPSSPGLPWPALLDLLEEAGGVGTEYRVGSPKWPVPPCTHQTTLDLGEHLRIRVRRAGLEAFVITGEDSWQQRFAWKDGEPPTVLVSGEQWSCARTPGLCPVGWRSETIGKLSHRTRGWSQDLFVHRLTGPGDL